MREEPVSQVSVRLFQPGDEADFRRLNEAWILKYFGIESEDLEAFADPQHQIIAKGGQIFMAVLDDIIVGCVGLKKIIGENRTYELVKMATDENYQRRGIGRALVQSAVKWARQQCGRRLYLETNHTLTPALRLYESAGFKHIPMEQQSPSPYVRSDVQMEMWLEPKWAGFTI